jgi:hypothetical protein
MCLTNAFALGISLERGNDFLQALVLTAGTQVHHREHAKELRPMLFVERPEKLLVVVSHTCQMLFTGLPHLGRLVSNNGIHRRYTLISRPLFSVRNYQVTQRPNQGISPGLVVSAIAFQGLPQIREQVFDAMVGVRSKILSILLLEGM